MMIKNYNNLYYIWISDNSNSVDNKLHDLLKQLVRQPMVMRFRLIFDRAEYNDHLYNTHNSTRLIR